MPVQKFRSIEAMKATPPLDRGIPLDRRIGAVLARAAGLVPAYPKPKGVFKFRSVEEMNEARDRWESARVQAGIEARK